MTCKSLAFRLVASLGLLATAAGCPSFSSMQTARTVPPGKTEHAVGVQVFGLSGVTTTETDVDTGETVNKDPSVFLPQFEYGLRYGLTEDSDVGFKFYFLGLQGDYKYRFHKGGQLESSVAPGASAIAFGTGDASITILYLHLPLYFDFVASESTRFMFGPKVIQQLAFGSSTEGGTRTADATFVGGAVAIDLLLGETFRLRPEVNFFKNLDKTEATAFQGGLGFAF